MKIRQKILTYISAIIIGVIAVAFVFIYILFYEYREEEFQQVQNNKIQATIKSVEKFKSQSEEISFLLDEQDIHDFYDEKLRVYDDKKGRLFSSLDDLEIRKGDSILENLSPNNAWIETKEDQYDLIGVYVERNGKGYYGISKAYDKYGQTKLDFLRNSLIVIFLVISIIIILVSIYISRTISRPIIELEKKISNYNLEDEVYQPVAIETTTTELNSLTNRFNELLMRTKEVFKFQKHTINHISHQLKTPIAVLVSELEKIQEHIDNEEVNKMLNKQKVKAKSLGEIINVLLEISKISTHQSMSTQNVRVDELIFDCIAELNIIHPNFVFDILYAPTEMQEENLILALNPSLIKQAFSNLLSNCVSYSDNNAATVKIQAHENQLSIQFVNQGESITDEEEKFLFKHFFRGRNSELKDGHGLGLMLTKRILNFHKANIFYEKKGEKNIFTVEF